MMAKETERETVHAVHFAVDASVIFQLGEHLISDAVQALVELIKNSYDADATQVLVEVDTMWRGVGPAGVARHGRIIVSDNGRGMTRSDLERGWLTLSNSPKRDFKRAAQQTPLGRTPLGEKGLGRLGSQRLGHDIEIVTISDREPRQFRLAYSWDSFSNVPTVEGVDLELAERPTNDPSGTWITIVGLKTPEAWTESEPLKDLEDGLSQLVSPYGEVADFLVDIAIDGRTLELARIARSVLQAAHIHYDIAFDATTLKVTGRAKLAFFEPPSGPALRRYHEIVVSDQGRAFFAFLREELEESRLNLREATGNGWFVEFSTEVRLSDLQPRLFNPNPREPLTRAVANPGPFRGSVDSFDLGEASVQEQTVFDSKKTFRDYIKRFSGIRVYRDGFGIRVDRDWLHLGETSTSGRSYYGLRPFNTLGYIAVSAVKNPELLEKTDREGFQITPHYENFYRLLRELIAFSERAQTQLRRSYNKFAKTRLARDAEVETDASPLSLADRIQATLSQADRYRAPVHAYAQTMRRGLESVEHSLADATGSEIDYRAAATNGAIARALGYLAELRAEVDRADSSLRDLDQYLASLSRMDPVGALLREQVQDLESRLTELYEAASLGLTAEALSHEIAHIADQLSNRVTRIQRAPKPAPVRTNGLSEFLEFVASSAQGLRSQLSHLAPSLRYARDQKEIITMSRFLRELFAYHHERLDQTNIELSAEVTGGGDFAVELNRGKLTQVFDNLLLNSEYWVRRKTHRGKRPTIRARVEQPFVYFSDSGPGVDPRYDGILFQPFVSAKPRGEGRGLGLFIVRQLLAAEGCTIELADERNDQGRRYVFELNFAEVARER